VIKARLGDRLDGWIRTAFPFVFHTSLGPDALSVIGAVVSLGAAWVLAEGAFVAGGLLMLAGGFFDLIDGVVARDRGVTTRFGAFLDSTLDRLVDMAIFLGVALHYARIGEPGVVAVAGFALVSSVLVSYAQARAELVLPSFRVGWLERGERVGILATGLILGFPVVALWMVAVGSTITFLQRLVVARREMNQLDRIEREDPDRPSDPPAGPGASAGSSGEGAGPGVSARAGESEEQRA
jgi:phosphatidylglycerophosphate synthase